MDQPESQSLNQPQIICTIHNQPVCALKWLYLEKSPIIKCIQCIIKEQLNGKQLISMFEIFNQDAEKVSCVLPRLTDEQLTKLKKIQNNNTDNLITTIENFYKSLKEEAIQKINEQEKTTIKMAQEFIEKQNEIKEKHLEYQSSIKQLQDLISSNQNNQNHLNEELKKYFQEVYQIQDKRQQEIQKLLMNYENIIFSEKIPKLLKERILYNISKLNYFQVSSEEKAKEIDGLSFKQQEVLQALVNSSQSLSWALSMTDCLLGSKKPLNFSYLQTLFKENRNQERCQNPKELLSQTQWELLESSNSNYDVNKILKILKKMGISDRMQALSEIVENLPVQDILGEILYKTQDSKCLFMSSLFPESKKIKSEAVSWSGRQSQKIFNQGFSSLYSDFVLDPKLKYKLEIYLSYTYNSNEKCYIGLLPDSQKDQQLMSHRYSPISFYKSTDQYQTIFICISECIFIVCYDNKEIIYQIPEEEIESTNQYRIGLQFQTNTDLNQSQNNQIPSQQQQQQSYNFSLSIKSFQILTVFPSFCV